MNISERLNRLMIEKKMKKSDLAKAMDTSSGYISDILDNPNKKIGSDKLASLKRNIPNLNIDWLLNGIEPMFISEYETLCKEIQGHIPPELESIIEEYIKTGDEKVKERMLGIMEGIRIAIKKWERLF